MVNISSGIPTSSFLIYQQQRMVTSLGLIRWCLSRGAGILTHPNFMDWCDLKLYCDNVFETFVENRDHRYSVELKVTSALDFEAKVELSSLGRLYSGILRFIFRSTSAWSLIVYAKAVGIFKLFEDQKSVEWSYRLSVQEIRKLCKLKFNTAAWPIK